MRAPEQPQQPPPPPPNPPPPQQLPAQLPLQRIQERCSICLEDIEYNEAKINCNTCNAVYHYGEIITWITMRSNNRESQTCPSCRSDMSWVFGNRPVTPLGIQPAESLPNIDNWPGDA